MWLATLTLALGMLEPEVATTEEIDLSWTVSGPDGCDDAAFRRQLAVLLTETSETPAEDLKVAVELRTGADGGWTIDLRLEDAAGASERHFAAARCETVVEAAALVVAMKVDPTVLGARPEASPEPEAPPPPPTPAPVVEPVQDPGAAKRLRFGIRVQGGVAALSLPGVTGQLGGQVFLSGAHWRTGLGGRYRFATRASLPDRAAGGNFDLGAAQLVGCGLVRRGSFELPLCGAFEAGVIRARGFGIAQTRESRRPWLALRLQPGAAYAPRPWLAVGLALDLGLVASAERYFIEDLGDVYAVGPVELGGLFFVEFRLLGGRA